MQNPVLLFLFGHGKDRKTKAVRIAKRSFFVVFLILVVFLIRAEKPWEGDIPAHLASGESLSVNECVRLGLFVAAAVNALLCILLHVTAGWWAVWVPPPPSRPRRPIRRAGLLTLLLIAAGLGLFLRWNLANGSLWWDEVWSLKRVISGYQEMDASDPPNLRFQPVGWTRTFFYYRKPTNHVAFSVASRAGLETWRFVSRHSREQFMEGVFRAPALAAAIGSIFLIGILLWKWGYPAAGVTAAVLLAIHPWHIRYGVDGRAFSLMLFFSLLAALWLTDALTTRKWRHWLLFGLAQFLLVWNFPHAAYLALCFVLAGLGGIALTLKKPEDRFRSARHLVLVNLLAAMAFLQVAAPLIIQALEWTDIQQQQKVSAALLSQAWFSVTTGMPYPTQTTVGDPVSVAGSGQVPYWLPPVLTGGMLLLMAAGYTRLIASKHEAVWAISAMLAGAVLTVAVSHLAGTYFYTRYLIYTLVPFLVLGTLGLETFGWAVVGFLPRPARSAVPMVCILFVAGFSALTSHQRAVFGTRSYEPLREVAGFIAARAGDDPTSVTGLGFNLGAKMATMYNPHLQYFEKVEDLVRFTEEARVSSRPLYVFYGHSAFNRMDAADDTGDNAGNPFPYLDNRELFVPETTFPGIEPELHYHILRYTGKPLEGADG